MSILSRPNLRPGPRPELDFGELSRAIEGLAEGHSGGRIEACPELRIYTPQLEALDCTTYRVKRQRLVRRSRFDIFLRVSIIGCSEAFTLDWNFALGIDALLHGCLSRASYAGDMAQQVNEF